MMCMLPMPAMSMVHKQMHQRAGEQEQIGQDSKQVCAVFGKEQKPGYCEKTIQHPTCSGVMRYFIPVSHGNLLKVQRGAAATHCQLPIPN